MSCERRTLTREEAAAFTAAMERRAEAIGVPLDQWILRPGKPNDIRQGSGPRFAIVQAAQEHAAKGRRYGQVLGSIVIQGNGDRYKIRTHDLAGFVCANGYCEAVPPSQIDNSGAIATPTGATSPLESSSASEAINPGVQEPAPRFPVQVQERVAYSPNPALLEILSKAYRCPCFDSACQTMRWDPTLGHIPRGYLGATGRLEEVELVMVLAEPGDPQPGDHETMEEAIRHATWAFREGEGQFHRNARFLLEKCWEGLSFEDQLRRVWITESVLCSAEVSSGPVPRSTERACGDRYLKRQLDLLPGALVVAFGNKAADRLARIGLRGFEKAFALGKPGCFQEGARPSWERVATILRRKRQDP